MRLRTVFQAFILASYVLVNGYVHTAVADHVPLVSWRISAALCGFYSLFALCLLVWRGWSVRHGRSAPQGWILFDSVSLWGSIVPIVTAIFVLMPAASREVQLICLAFLLGAIAVIALGSARWPPSRGFGSWIALPVPVALAAFFAIYDHVTGILLALWTGAFTAAFLIARATFEALLNSAHTARLEAEAGRDARSRFLVSASHDLGQPLQAARLSFDQALRAATPEKRSTAALRAHWAFDWAETMLRSMIEHLRLESGEALARIERVELGRAIAECAELHESTAGLAGLVIDAVPSSLAARADPNFVQRILSNYLTNAIRHSKGTRVLVGARRSKERVQLWVVDNGRGVAEQDVERLFGDYAQGSDHGTEVRGGFGLGLASARRMAALMEGDAGLERRWVGGAAFWLDLPRA